MDERLSSTDGAVEAAPSRRELLQAVDVLLRALVPSAKGTAEPARDAGAEPWVSVERAAQHASVSPGTVREWVRQGALPAGRHGNIVRVRLSDLDEMLSKNRSVENEVKADPAEVGARKSPRVAAVVASLADRRGTNG